MTRKISSFSHGKLLCVFFFSLQSVSSSGERPFVSMWTIHVRTLSSGCVHPLTSATGIIHSLSILGLHIHGDRILVLGDSSGRCGLVWDWKTGEQIAKIASVPHCFSVRLLGRRLILSSL